MATIATDREVQAAKANGGKPTDFSIKGVPGLRLRVMESGLRTWSLIYTRSDGKKRRVSLGEYPGIGLKKAKEEVSRLRVQIGDGKDPAQGNRPATLPSDVPETIDELVPLFLEKHAKPNTRKRTFEETERALKRLLVHWKGRRLDSIRRRDVIGYIDGIANKYPISANRTLAVLSKLFNWAVEKDLLQASPCFQVKAPSPTTSRDRVLTDDELRLFLSAAEKIEAPFGLYLKMLTLTAQRRTEVGAMRWSEIDLAEKTWLIPAPRSKNRQENLLPLPPQAMTILETLPRYANCDYVFTTKGKASISNWSKSKKNLDKLIAEENGGAPIAHWTFHDLRRTGDTTMHRLGVISEVVDAVLNHKITGIRATYNRYKYFPEKKDALEKWAGFLDKLRNEQMALAA